MKALVAVFALALAGCAMTPTQKRVAAVIGSVVVVGAVAAHGNGSPQTQASGAGLPITKPPGLGCRPQPDGSCR